MTIHSNTVLCGLRRLQHRIIFIIEDIGEDEPAAAGRWSTDDLQGLQARIRSITRDMDALGRSCSAETAMGFLPASDHSNTQPCCSRSTGRQATPIRVTVSPEKPAKQGRTSPLAFAATSQRYQRKYKNQKKDREHHRHQRRRRARRATCSETVEDTSSTSLEECIKSKTRMRRQRRTQKFTSSIHGEVTLSTVITWLFRLHFSARLYPHVIFAQNYQLKCETSPAQAWSANFARPPECGDIRRVTPWWMHRTQEKANTEVITRKNPPRAEHASTSCVTQFQEVSTPSRVEYRIYSLQTSRHSNQITQTDPR